MPERIAEMSRQRGDLFAETFAQKWHMPYLELSGCTPITSVAEPDERARLPIRAHAVLRQLRSLRPDSATGPDGIPARILRECAVALAVPVAKLTRRIITLGIWPRSWCAQVFLAQGIFRSDLRSSRPVLNP